MVMSEERVHSPWRVTLVPLSEPPHITPDHNMPAGVRSGSSVSTIR